MSTGFNQQLNQPVPIVFAPVSDDMLENEALQPPLIRDRWQDSANIYLTADGYNQVNSQANTSSWAIGSDNSNGRVNNKIYISRLKKLMPTFAQTSKYASNINERNDTITFKSISTKPTVVYTAKIQNYNYTRMITDWQDMPITNPATYTQVNAASGWYPPTAGGQMHGDPADGLIDHILGALNTAMGSDGVVYDPAVQGQFKSHFSNGNLLTRTVGAGGDTWISSNRYRHQGTGENLLTGNALYGMLYCELASVPIGFVFTGGNAFNKGIHCWGCEPIADPALVRFQYAYGACQFQYSRWLDVVSPELTQYSKLRNQGTATSSGLLFRLYNDGVQKIGVENTLFGGIQQVINMRKDESISFISVQMLDEYGDLYHVPKGSVTFNPANVNIEREEWPSNNGLSIGCIAQL